MPWLPLGEEAAAVAASFAAELGTAAYALPEAATPEQLRLAAAFVDLATTIGWAWQPSQFGHSDASRLSLSECIGLAGPQTTTAGRASRSFFNRFHARVIRSMLRTDVYTCMAPAAASAAAAGAGDARTSLASYPVIDTLVRRLVATTTAGQPAAVSAEAAAPASTCGGDDSAAAVVAARDHAWRVFTDVTRTMARTSATARARLATQLAHIDSAAATVAAAAASSASGPPIGEAAAIEASSPGGGETLLGIHDSSSRVRASVFINSLVAALPALTPWAQPTADDDRVLWLLFVLRAIAAFDPWLLVAGGTPGAPAADGGGSRGAQVRRLPEAAIALVQAALERCANPAQRPGVEDDSVYQARRADMQLQLVALLPLLLPGYAAGHLLPAQAVSVAALWPSWPRQHPAHEFVHAAHPTLNGVYRTALRLVRTVMGQRLPVDSRREITGDALAPFRRFLVALFTALAVTGSPVLLQLLHYPLREGPQAVAYGDMVLALNVLASRVASSGPSPRALLLEALVTCLVHVEPTGAAATGLVVPPAQLHHAHVGRLLCDRLVVPLVQRLNPADARRMFADPGFMRELAATAREVAGTPPLESNAAPPLSGWHADGSMLGHSPPSLMHYLTNVVSAQGVFKSGGAALGEVQMHHVTTCLQLLGAFYDVLPRHLFIWTRKDKQFRPELFRFRQDDKPAPIAALGELVEEWRNTLPPEAALAGAAGTPAGDALLKRRGEYLMYGLTGVTANACRDVVEYAPASTDNAAAVLALKRAAFACESTVYSKTALSLRNIYWYCLASRKPLFDHLVDNSMETIVFSASSGATEGGLPLLTDATAFRRVAASLEAFAGAPAVPSTRAASRALVEATASQAAGPLLLSAPAAGGGGGGGGGGSGAGPLTQLLNASQVQAAADLDPADHGDGGGGGGAGSGGAGHRGALRGTASLVGEGADRAYAASQVLDATTGSEDDDSPPVAGPAIAAPPGGVHAASTHHTMARSVVAQRIVPRAQELELDFFNSNPAMLALLRLLDYAAVMSVTQAGDEEERKLADAEEGVGVEGARRALGGGPDALAGAAPWALCVVARLTHQHYSSARGTVAHTPCPLPTRLFLLKVILNRAELFRPYARALTLPIIRVLLELRDHAEAQAKAGKPPCLDVSGSGVASVFHYLLRDACELLCSYWPSAGADGGGGGEALQPRRQQTLQYVPPPPPPPPPGAAGDDGDGDAGGGGGLENDAATAAARLQAESERATCRDFLTYLVRCAPLRMRLLREMHIGFIRVLIRSWGPVGIRPDMEWTLHRQLLVTDSTSGSSLSDDGAKVLVGCAVLVAVVEEAGQLPYDPARDVGPSFAKLVAAAEKRSLTPSAMFCAALVGGRPLGDVGFSQKPLLVHTAVADAVGRVLACAWRHARGAGGGAPQSGSSSGGGGGGGGGGSGGSGSAAAWRALAVDLQAAVEAKLEELHSQAQRVLEGTSERGFRRFFVCADAVAAHYPPIVKDWLAQQALSAQAHARGRLYLRAQELQLTLRLLRAGVAGRSCALDALWVQLAPRLPVLLKAQVTGRRRGGSVQQLTLELLHALLAGGLPDPLHAFLPLLEPGASH